MTPLAKLIKNLWEGSVEYEEATDEFSAQQILGMNSLLRERTDVFKNGVPFPEDSPQFAELLKTNFSARNIKRMVERFE